MKSSEIWKSKAKLLEGDKRMLEEKIQKLTAKPEGKKNESRNASLPKKNELSKSQITESAVTLKVNQSCHDINYENTINHLQSEIKQYKNMTKQLKSDKNIIISRRHNLEDLFKECIEVARNDLKKDTEPAKLIYSYHDPNEAISEPEKRKILYTLIAKPEISELIRSYLFRSRKSLTPNKMIIKSNISKHGLSSHVFSTPKKQRIRHLPYYNIL